MDSKVSDEFERCLYLLIVNMKDLSITVIKNDNLSERASAENLTRAVLSYNCEALITGALRPLAFNILADAYITRFFGADSSVKNALELMEKGSLIIIKNVEGTDNCGGHHY